jgi:hypothetical protein
MKKLALFFMTATVAFATVCLLQSRKLASQQEQLTSLNAQAEQKSEENESLRASEKSAREEAQELQRVTADLTAQRAAHQQPEGVVATPRPVTTAVPLASVENQVEQAGSTKPTDDQSGFSGFLSKMMNDPESRKFIRDQQRMIMDQLYAPLVKQLALSPDESEKFKDLLADNTMKGAENASSLFAGGTNQTQSLEKLASAQQSLDDQVKALLGEDRYAAYKDYQQTVAERMQLNQFKQTAGIDNPLTDQQSEALLGIMKEEKAATAAATGQSFPEVGKDPSNFQAMLSDESLEKLLQSQGIVNERVYQRASQFLSPDQMTAFGKFQTNQFQMMRMGMTMARKLFTPDKSTAGANQ